MPRVRLPPRAPDPARYCPSESASPGYRSHMRRPGGPREVRKAVAVDDDVVQHGAGHLMDGAPGAADIAHHLKATPLVPQVRERFFQPYNLLACQAVKIHPRRFGANCLDANITSIAANHRRAQFEISACIAGTTELPDLPFPRRRDGRGDGLVELRALVRANLAPVSRTRHGDRHRGVRFNARPGQGIPCASKPAQLNLTGMRPEYDRSKFTLRASRSARCLCSARTVMRVAIVPSGVVT